MNKLIVSTTAFTIDWISNKVAGEEWNNVFKNAVKLRYDYPGVFEESQIFAIAPDWNSESVKITNNTEEGLTTKFDDLIKLISRES